MPLSQLILCTIDPNIHSLSPSLSSVILQPAVHPGECWCFHGAHGNAVIRLAVPAHVTGVTLEHIPKALAISGTIDSAPKEFTIKVCVWLIFLYPVGALSCAHFLSFSLP